MVIFQNFRCRFKKLSIKKSRQNPELISLRNDEFFEGHLIFEIWTKRTFEFETTLFEIKWSLEVFHRNLHIVETNFRLTTFLIWWFFKISDVVSKNYPSKNHVKILNWFHSEMMSFLKVTSFSKFGLNERLSSKRHGLR